MFKCSQLQTIFEETKDIFEFSKDYMNSISDDIAAVEKLLIQYNPPSVHVLKIGSTLHEKSFDYHDSRIAELFQENECQPGDNLVIDEQIIWDPEKKRLFYVERISKEWGYDRLNAPSGPTFPFTEITHKPLMETKFSIKKKVHPHLPKIIESVAIEFGYTPVWQESKSAAPDFDDDIPF